MTELTPREIKAEPPQQRVNGVVDVLRANRIAGWAIDRLDSAGSVTVEVFRDGHPYQSVTADRYRPDLERGGIGTGRYGFSVEIDPPVDAGLEFTVTAIARTDDGHSAPLKPTGAAEHPVRPELLLLHRLAASVEELKQTQKQPASPHRAVEELAERLEMTQLRLEAALATVEKGQVPKREARLPRVAYIAGGLGLLSLAAGIGSFWIS